MNSNHDSTPVPLRLRPATSQDAPAVAEVYLRSRKQFLTYAPLAHSDQDVRQWVREVLIAEGMVTVADRGGIIQGFLAVNHQKGVNWIDQLYLDPPAVGQGIGTQLLAYALENLSPPVRLYTFQANVGARRFYERHGFSAIEFSDGQGNEEKCPDVLYEWRGS